MRINSNEVNTKDAVSHAMVIVRTGTAQFKNHKDRKHVSDIISLLKKWGDCIFPIYFQMVYSNIWHTS